MFDPLLRAALPALLALHPSATTVQEPLVRVAPESTRMVLVCEDVPGLLDGLRQGPLGALWSDEALASLREEWMRALTEELDEEVFPGGPRAHELIFGVEAAALFVGPFVDDEPGVGAVVLALRDELTKDVAAMLEDFDPESELLEVAGHTLRVAPSDDEGWMVASEWLRGLVFAFADERADALAWATAMLEGLDGAPEHSTSMGAALLRRRSPFPALQVHVDVGALVRDSAAGDGGEGSLAELDAFGFTRMGWGELAFGAPPGGALDARGSLEVPQDGFLGTLCRAFRPAPIELGRMAPRDTIDASFYAIDVQTLWRGVEDAVATFAPDAMAATGQSPSELIEQRLQEAEALLGVDLRRSLIDNLTGEFVGFLLPDAHADGSVGAALGMVQLDGTGVVGLRDPDALEELIDAVIALSGSDALVGEQELEGRWVQTLDLSDVFPFELRPCWAVLDDALVISYGTSSMAALLRQCADEPPPSWLDDEARLRRARELVAEGACSLSVADAPGLFRLRVLEPLRAAEIGFEDDPYALSRLMAIGLAEGLLGEEASELDIEAKARAMLREAIGTCERLVESGLSGRYLTSMSWVDGTLGFRMWTEPAQRD